MNDTEQKAFLAEFIKSGLVLREWEEDGTRCRMVHCNGRLVKQCYVGEDSGPAQWLQADASSRDIANEILRQLQERADEVGIAVVSDIYAGAKVWACCNAKGRWLQADGSWAYRQDGRNAMYVSRPLALLAAMVAVEKEKCETCGGSGEVPDDTISALKLPCPDCTGKKGAGE